MQQKDFYDDIELARKGSELSTYSLRTLEASKFVFHTLPLLMQAQAFQCLVPCDRMKFRSLRYDKGKKESINLQTLEVQLAAE